MQGKILYKAWYKGKPDISNLHLYGCNTYVVDYKGKAKDKMAARSLAGTLLAMKPRINGGFGMEPKFLLEEMLSSMSLSSVIKMGKAQNQMGRIVLLTL